MSLPPALLQRLAQRGLVQKQKQKEAGETSQSAPVENEEVIAEDYDEMESDTQQHGAAEEYQSPSQYDLDSDTVRKRTEDNFWLERMKARMGEAGSAVGHKGCPNKYNIWHKCNLYCVNRWGDGHEKPSSDYMHRYKRMLRKYPLPKGWTEMYDPGCGCYYFANAADNVVSWLPPTHPKSQVSKSAATLRRQMEESTGETEGSDDEQHNSVEEADERESAQSRHQREVDEIINNSMRPRSPATKAPLDSQDFPSLQEAVSAAPQRKQKSRDLERTLSRQGR